MMIQRISAAEIKQLQDRVTYFSFQIKAESFHPFYAFL